MTREEAMRWLNYHINITDYEETDELYIALKMAIEALSAEKSEDCISREKLDKALYENFHEEDSPNNITDVRLGAVRNFIRNFPSINPQELKLDTLDEIRAEIIKLQLYKMFEGEDTFYIERDEVLQIINKYKAESEDN